MCREKGPIRPYNEKRQSNSLERFIWNQLHFITNYSTSKTPNIHLIDIINRDTHKEIISQTDYNAPSCPELWKSMKKYDFQNRLKSYLTKRLVCLLEFSLKASFQVLSMLKMMVAETSLYCQEESPNSLVLYQPKIAPKVD